MLMFGMLHHLLLTGTCLCVYGAPFNLPNFNPTRASLVTTTGSTHATDLKSIPSISKHVTGLTLNVGAGGGTGPHGRPGGIDAVTQTENGDSLGGRSRLSEAGREAWSQSGEVKKIGSTAEMGDSERQSEAASVLSVDSESIKEDAPAHGEQLIPTGGTEQLDMDASTRKRNPDRFLASTIAPSYLQNSYSQKSNPARVEGMESFDSHQDKETSLPEPPNPSVSLWTQTSHSPTPPFVAHQTSTPLAIWGHDRATISSLPDPFLLEIGPSLMPREDGPESLWTEAARPGGEETTLPMSQDEATEATMSSEALPLIFEPFEDVTPERAAAAVTHVSGSGQPRGLPRSEVGLDQLVTIESDRDGPSHASPVLIPDGTSPWQTSGSELLEPFGSLGPSVSQRQVGTEPEDHSEKVSVKTPKLEDNLSSAGPSLSSFQQAMTMVTMTTHQPAHKSTSEEMESEENFSLFSTEELDDDDEDENSEESVEEESEEDLTETPKTSSTQPPYSLIPPPPVWVQRNQGLMRSWVELIREKAGYVSGMLAPVGIGITGALLIVGALYSIRMIHRKRRNSFKHQRRKVRQQEQPREPGTSRQDQAMLLADSSEDEF